MAFDAPDDPARHARLAEHFAHLLSLEAPARESYLQQHPPALRDELRSLLRFHETQAAVSLAAGGMERWIAEGPAVLPAGTRVESFVIE